MPILPILAALLGLLAGPSLHSVAISSGADLEFHPSRSTCRSCHELGQLTALRCLACGHPEFRILAVAALSGAGMAGMAWRLGTSWLLPAHLVMVAMTTVLVVTDFDHLRLPNRIVYPGTVAGFALLTAGAVLESATGALPRAILGGVVYFAGFLSVYLIARGQGFGFGDVKLAVMLGLFAAFYSWRTLVMALFVTAVLGGVPAIVLLAMGKGGKTAIPYGPPMIAGTWLAIVFLS